MLRSRALGYQDNYQTPQCFEVYLLCVCTACVGGVVMGSRSMCVVVYVWRATDNPMEAIQLSLPCGSWDQAQVTKLAQQSLNSPGTSPDLVVLL